MQNILGFFLPQPWPLFMKSLTGEVKKVFLKPGQMVWYESAKLIHGRWVFGQALKPVKFGGILTYLLLNV